MCRQSTTALQTRNYDIKYRMGRDSKGGGLTQEEPRSLLDELRALPDETERVSLVNSNNQF